MQGFDLVLPAGRAWLDLPCHAPGQGLAQARALAAALPALAALEAWLGTDLPCPEPTAAGSASARALEAGAADLLRLPFEPGTALAGGQLCLPWAAIVPGQPPPASLAAQWPQLAAQMCLQSLAAERINAAGLVPGAVLLLPAAFAQGWAVLLQSDEPSAASALRHRLAAATWLPQQGQLRVGADLPAQPAASTADLGPWSVWCAAALSVDLRAWLGVGAASLPPATAAPGAVELRLHGQPVAWGRLLPCGTGWALRVDRAETPQAVLAWT